MATLLASPPGPHFDVACGAGLGLPELKWYEEETEIRPLVAPCLGIGGPFPMGTRMTALLGAKIRSSPGGNNTVLILSLTIPTVREHKVTLYI